jgi:hypothetical protein
VRLGLGLQAAGNTTGHLRFDCRGNILIMVKIKKEKVGALRRTLPAIHFCRILPATSETLPHP